MNGVREGASAAAKVLEVLKDLPLWILIGLTLSAGALLFVPVIAQSVAPMRPWIMIAGIVSACLAFARGTGTAVEWVSRWRTANAPARTFHITAFEQQSFWHVAKQKDDSLITQVSARLLVKNLTDNPLALVSARLLRPWIRGEVVSSDLSVRATNRNVYGDAVSSGHAIPAKMSLPASAHIMVRGLPWREPKKQVRVTIAIRDDEGREGRVKMILRVMPAVQATAALPTLEMVSSLPGPIEKQVAAVLQAEVTRYDKCGRSSGGLGSVHLVVGGHQMTSFVGEGWVPNSPRNQSIYDKPDEVQLKSDNLEALMAYYARLSEEERRQFGDTLLDRIDEGLGYLRVTYFIVYVLWKIGKLPEALRRAKARLPQAETKAFGLSNTLMLLNGLLRYRYPDFPNEMLDEIERFLYGMNEHSFQIPETIAAIRAMRLHEV